MLNKQKTPTNYRWVQIWNAKGKITAKGICKKYPSAINIVFKGDALHFEVNDFDATRIDSDFNKHKLVISTIDDMIHRWHELPRTVDVKLNKFLNCTWETYAKWVENGE